MEENNGVKDKKITHKHDWENSRAILSGCGLKGLGFGSEGLNAGGGSGGGGDPAV